MSKPLSYIEPDWPAPPWVRAVSTTRQGGFSCVPFNGLNLADHVGDDPVAVTRNRDLLRKSLNFPVEPSWLMQVHGCNVVEATGTVNKRLEADGSFTIGPGGICVVLTADCLPILLCDQKGTQVAAVHAGWRGLAAGVVEAALRCFSVSGAEILAWLGPAIGPGAFEVGEEVRDIFIKYDSNSADAFVSNKPHHWLMDIYQLARERLVGYGVDHIYGGDFCTVSDAERFYSYRRSGMTGRMGSLIWINE